MVKILRSKRGRWAVILAFVTLIVFVSFVHSFLAINQPVKGDVLVVEGWAAEYDYVLARVVREFNQGGYARILVSGLIYQPGDKNFADGSDAARGVKRLVALGIAAALVEATPSDATGWNRTSSMAFAVAARLHALGRKPVGVNVVTLGPHARQTLLAFTRAIGSGVPVGVISVPKDDYAPDRWWASRAGIKKTTKDFAGWAREVLFGRRT